MTDKKTNNLNMEKELDAIGWTALHTRILSHRIGDGSCNSYGHYEWNNKNVEKFLALADSIRIRYWGPIVSDKYQTMKVIINKKVFTDYARLFNTTAAELIHDPSLLMETVCALPEDHKIQALLAFIVDDGSVGRWMPTVFEDQNRQVFEKVKVIWDNIFPNTSNIYIYTTKKGTKVYHLNINREGIVALANKITELVNKNGAYADLWSKQKDFEKRYQKAISQRAVQLDDTNKQFLIRKAALFEYLQKHKYITMKQAQQILELSVDRTRLILRKLVRNYELFQVWAGNRTRYCLENEDISYESRKSKILEFTVANGRVCNEDCRRLLNLGASRVYVILKKLQRNHSLNQTKEKGRTFYTLPPFFES